MDEQIEILKQQYFELDKPVPYKDYFLYPVKVQDYYSFYNAIKVLTLDKNKDVNGISMSHLGYLISCIQNMPDEKYELRFSILVELCFKIKDGLFCSECGNKIDSDDISKTLKSITKELSQQELVTFYSSEFGICKQCGSAMQSVIRYSMDERNQPVIKVENITITKEDYDEIRRIICYQNMPDFDDAYVDPDWEAEMAEKEKMQNKNIAFPSLEKQKCCIVASGCGYNFESLDGITLRKFVLLLQTIDKVLHYKIYKANENSGAVTFKGGLDHWIYEKQKTKLDNAILADSFTSKLSPFSVIK